MTPGNTYYVVRGQDISVAQYYWPDEDGEDFVFLSDDGEEFTAPRWDVFMSKTGARAAVTGRLEVVADDSRRKAEDDEWRALVASVVD